MRSISRFGIPIPLSRTENSRQPPSTSAPTSTALPASEYLIALSSRFAIALTICRRSHATNALDPMDFRDIVHEHRGAQRHATFGEGQRAQIQDGGRWSEQVQLVLTSLAGERTLEHRRDRALGHGIRVTGVTESCRGRV